MVPEMTRGHPFCLDRKTASGFPWPPTHTECIWAGPQAGQPVPDGMTVVRVKGSSGIALIRILVQDRRQFAAIDAARRQSSCKALS